MVVDKSLLLGFAVGVCGALIPAPQAAQAAGAVQQCRASDGSSLYTDKPCRVVGAQSVPMRDDLAMRIVHEQVREAQITGAEVPIITTTLSTMASAREAIGRRAVAGGCARTPTQLAMDLRGAFALGDVNRIAESYHWVGMSSRSANATMQRLERLARHSVVDAQYYDAQISGGEMYADAGRSIGGGAGVLQVTFGGESGAAIQDFDVERYAGCYFVRF